MNELSTLCRLLGSLFYRAPDDSVLAPVLTLIKEDKLKQSWPLEQDELLTRWKSSVDMPQLVSDYQAMLGQNGSVSPYAHDYSEQSEAEYRTFLQQVGMPLTDKPADHFGLLLLAASWIEDNSGEEKTDVLEQFFALLLPCCGRFLGKVEAHATSAFYRTLAMITREALQAMVDELDETEESDE